MARIEENQETFLEIYTRLGENFKEHREKKGWTQQQLCDAMKNIFPDMHFTQSDISEYEWGCELGTPPVHMRSYKILCLAFTLEMHPSEIYSPNRVIRKFPQKSNERLQSEEAFKSIFGRNLNSIMKQKKLSSISLAALLNKEATKMEILKSPNSTISEKTIQRYRKGERNPPLGYLILFCKVLDVEISDFLS